MDDEKLKEVAALGFLKGYETCKFTEVAELKNKITELEKRLELEKNTNDVYQDLSNTDTEMLNFFVGNFQKANKKKREYKKQLFYEMKKFEKLWTDFNNFLIDVKSRSETDHLHFTIKELEERYLFKKEIVYYDEDEIKLS